MREPLRFSLRHWWNLVLALIVTAGVTLWALRILDGRVALGAVLLWLVAGTFVSPSIIQEHMAFADRWVFHDYGKARLRYRRAVDSGKGTPQAYCSLASLSRAEGDLAEASRLLEEAVVKRPGDPHLLLLLSRVLSAEGRHEEALAAAMRCRETGAPRALAETALGDVLKAKGEAVAAASAYQNALEANPRLADCRVNLAGIYLSMGERQAAEREVREALKISAKHPDALYWAGHIEAAGGNKNAAMSHFKSALQSRSLDDNSLSTPYSEIVKAASGAASPPVRSERYGPQDAGLPPPPQTGPSSRKEIR